MGGAEPPAPVRYPRDATGVTIGADTPLADSHRHFSHMLGLYPMHELTWDRSADRDIMRTTFDHWTEDRSLWAGYSYAARWRRGWGGPTRSGTSARGRRPGAW
ncbi:hypothetical protein JBE04_12435 [Streptomyces sp. PRKS01-29]|nr:hypothetical protein [Streptomyces sabulosicollis]MBI0295258.1 hypothetical protein [Streptomyces sabulosicollis]